MSCCRRHCCIRRSCCLGHCYIRRSCCHCCIRRSCCSGVEACRGSTATQYSGTTPAACTTGNSPWRKTDDLCGFDITATPFPEGARCADATNWRDSASHKGNTICQRSSAATSVKIGKYVVRLLPAAVNCICVPGMLTTCLAQAPVHKRVVDPRAVSKYCVKVVANQTLNSKPLSRLNVFRARASCHLRKP